MVNSTGSNALLAGVCSHLARIFNCNVWALRAIFIVLLLVKTLLALLAYGAMALMVQLIERHRGSGGDTSEEISLQSPQFASRKRRIELLDQRFREWEDSLGR